MGPPNPRGSVGLEILLTYVLIKGKIFLPTKIGADMNERADQIADGIAKVIRTDDDLQA